MRIDEQTARAPTDSSPLYGHPWPDCLNAVADPCDVTRHFMLARRRNVELAGLLRGLFDQCALEVVARAGDLLEGVPNVYGPPGQSQTGHHETPSE
ncbi:hypothetical protein [Streptomyces albus]|uniref:hypothetical protein n=1 Tax=Streptomyces albus TaxID=1888 RepID=UPI00131B185F|nr:hypothetical protein [Streptomyces albus]